MFSSRASRTCRTALLALLWLASVALVAQQAQKPAETDDGPPPPGTPMYTLHVYTNLLQIPTLVADERLSIPKPLQRNQFAITLDSGPIFHPTQMRIEGDDPISMAVLIDAGGDQGYFIDHFAAPFAAMVKKSLRPLDRLSIFAVDCKLFRSALDAPATPEVAQTALERVLKSPGLHGEKTKGACRSSLHLWDAVATVSQSLKQQSGRRILLIASFGKDGGSHFSLEEASMFSSDGAIGIFGVRDAEEWRYFQRSDPVNTTGSPGRSRTGAISTDHDVQDPLGKICGLNGGIVRSVGHMQLEDTLETFVKLIRNRYIIEFPRPDNSEQGHHLIQVKVPSRPEYMVISTGASAPLEDPALANDPNRVKTSASPAVYGTRRPLDKKKQ